jgi:predicted DNA-binding protein (MmcQ/YjbR family)
VRRGPVEGERWRGIGSDCRGLRSLFHSAVRVHSGGMSRDAVNRICAELPGAEVSDPWGGGHDCWKVGGKMFAVVGARLPGVSVKTASVDEAEMLIAAGVGERAAYLHASWIRLPEDCGADELAHRLRQSYALVRAGLPKKVQKALPPG